MVFLHSTVLFSSSVSFSVVFFKIYLLFFNIFLITLNFTHKKLSHLSLFIHMFITNCKVYLIFTLLFPDYSITLQYTTFPPVSLQLPFTLLFLLFLFPEFLFTSIISFISYIPLTPVVPLVLAILYIHPIKSFLCISLLKFILFLCMLNYS